MISNFKALIPSFKPKALKLSINLLESEIQVPSQNEEFDKFSVQGTLSLVSLNKFHINRIVIQFLGFLNYSGCNERLYKDQKIENQIELLDQAVLIPQGTSNFGFELVLPRTLASSVNSKIFKLYYNLSAIVDYGNEQITHQIPVKVYNNQLIPHINTFNDSLSYSGSITNSINYKVEFSKRLFNTHEPINFRINIDSNEGSETNLITASILQKGTIFKKSNQGPEGEILEEVILAKTNNQTFKKDYNSQTQFDIPLKLSVIKQVLIKSIFSPILEVEHIVQILISYQLQGQRPQVRYIQIPIIITSKSRKFNIEYLPTYNQIELNSTHIPAAELPPIYSN